MDILVDIMATSISFYMMAPLLIVVPSSLQKQFLLTAHDKVGHQGTDRTMARLSEIAYWVGMGKDAGYYCSHCRTCQITKAPPNQLSNRLWLVYHGNW